MYILLSLILIVLVLNLACYFYKNFPNFFTNLKLDYINLGITGIFFLIILFFYLNLNYYEKKEYLINIVLTAIYFFIFNFLALKIKKIKVNIFLSVFPFIIIWYQVFFEILEDLLTFSYYDFDSMRFEFFRILIFLIPTAIITFFCLKYRKNKMNFLGLIISILFVLFLLFVTTKRIEEYNYFKEIKTLSDKEKVIKVYEKSYFGEPKKELLCYSDYKINFCNKMELLNKKNKLLFFLISQIKKLETEKDYLIFLVDIKEEQSQDEITDFLLSSLTSDERQKLKEDIKIFIKELKNNFNRLDRSSKISFEEFNTDIKEIYQKTGLRYKISKNSKNENIILIAFNNRPKEREKILEKHGLDYISLLSNLDDDTRDMFHYIVSFLELREKYLILALDCVNNEKENQNKFMVDFFLTPEQKKDFLNYYELIHNNIKLRIEIAEREYEDSTEGYYSFLQSLKYGIKNNKNSYNDEELNFEELSYNPYKEEKLKQYMDSLDEKDEFWRKIKEINYKTYLLKEKEI